MQIAQDERPLARIKKSNEHKIIEVMKQRGFRGDIGHTLDDLVRFTGLEKNSISGVRTEMENAGIIRRGDKSDRRWNKNKTRKQNVYWLVR